VLALKRGMGGLGEGGGGEQHQLRRKEGIPAKKKPPVLYCSGKGKCGSESWPLLRREAGV